jgi:hypothetical protein
LTVSGSVGVSNFPALQSVSVTNFPASQAVTGAVSVTNLPATQPVSGTVNVGNFPSTQAVSGSVSVSNFPATQPVSGLVTANPMPYGLFSKVVSVSVGPVTPYGAATQNDNTGTHAVMTHVGVTVSSPLSTGFSGVVVVTFGNLPGGSATYQIALGSAFTLDNVTFQYHGDLAFPLYLPANTTIAVTITTTQPLTVTQSAAFAFNGINLN